MRAAIDTGGSPASPAGSSSCADAVSAAAVSVGGARVASLSADDALSVVLAARHAAAAAFAVELEALARLASAYPDAEALGGLDEESAVVFELMAALGVSQRSAANRLSLAGQLTEVPALCAALRDGVLDASTGYLILERVRVLPATLRVEAVDRLLGAHAQLPGGLTRWQLTRLLGRIVATLDPRRTEQRQRDAIRDRRVWHHGPTAAGEEASLGMSGPAERVALCADSIDALARAILEHARRANGTPGNGAPTDSEAGPVTPPSATLEQARFDALDWLITGRPATTHPAWAESAHQTHDTVDEQGADCPVTNEGPGDHFRDTGLAGRGDEAAATGDGTVTTGCGCGRPRVTVVAQLTLSLATLLGLDDAPGELAGHGTIPASVARDLAASATLWRRLLTDPVDAHLVTQEIKSYRPNAAMRAYVLSRTGGVCASRGCTARRGLQIDHDTPHPRGPTSVTNNALLHQPHHQGKTCGAWCHHLHPETGSLTQTSPLGRTYTTVPLPPLGGALAGPPVRASDIRRRRLPGHEAGDRQDHASPLVHRLAAMLERSDAAVEDPDDHAGQRLAIELRPWQHAATG